MLGLGNPILCDDGVGYRVAMSLKEKVDMPDVDIKEAGIAGLDFLDMIAGYERVIVIDAIQTEKGKPGRIYRFGPDFCKQCEACIQICPMTIPPCDGPIKPGEEYLCGKCESQLMISEEMPLGSYSWCKLGEGFGCGRYVGVPR